MDGISSASAVVSLAAQLIVTTRDVINFLREIRDSPEELRSTIELLALLRGNFEQVKRLVEEQSVCVDIQSSLVSIGNALTFCESKIALVEQCVNKFKGVFDHRSSARKKWTSFKHVLKKGEIKRLQDQLGDARSNLQLALAIDANGIGVRNFQFGVAILEHLSIVSNNERLLAHTVSKAISQFSTENNLGSGSISANLTDATNMDTTITSDSTLGNVGMQHVASHSGSSIKNENHPSPTVLSDLRSEDKESRMFSPESPTQPRVISRQRMILQYMGILGYASVQTKSRFVDNTHNAHTFDKRFVSKERIIIFRPSFWKTQLELHFANTCGRISRTLSTDCVIGLKAEVFEMCRSGDLQGLQDAFYNGSIFLNVVDPLGMGLLHYAAGRFHKDLCTWLLSVGVGADRTNELGHTALTYMGTRSKIKQTTSVTKTMIEIARLLIGAQKDLSEFDVSEWFCEYDGPSEGAELILSQDLAKYHIRFPDDSEPLHPALASTLRLYAKDPEPWEPVVRTLIRSGADVHAKVRRNLTFLDQSEYLCSVSEYGTPLDELFKYTIEPLEGQAAASGWLQILASEGYNVLGYLEKESDWHPGPMQLTIPSGMPIGYENERRLVFDWTVHPTVSWDWWVSPKSSTFLLRQEFRLMAIKSLPDGMLIKRSWKETWPVILPTWSELHQYSGDASSRSHHKELLEFANNRATNRLKKKGRYEEPRKVPDRKVPNRKVPGAWPV